MRKNLLFIAATALIVVGCANEELRKDINESKAENAIGFASYTSKQTRAENSSATSTAALNNYQTSFEVWGYKNVKNASNQDVKERVFNQVDVLWNTPTANSTWQYSPIRFWDKQASSYEFYAASPKDLGWIMNDGGAEFNATNATYKISLPSFELDGKGVAIDNEASLPTSVSATQIMPDNKDIMISEDVTGYKAYSSNPVNLHFIHILSRLNIGVMKDASVLPDADYTVRLKSLAVKQLKGNGKFNESKVTTPYDATSLPKGTNGRWEDLQTVTKIDNGFTSITKDGNNNVIGAVIGGTNFSYVYQALVIPQNIAFQRIALDGVAHNPRVCDDVNEYNYYFGENKTKAEFDALDNDAKTIPAYVAPTDPYLVINYTITPTATDATTEEYVAYYNLAAVFGATNDNTNNIIAFNEGWMNTLKITIRPAAINFAADVYEWATNVNKENAVVD